MAVSMCIMNSFAIVVSCLVFIPVEAVYYVNYVFVVLMRGFLYSTLSSSVMAAFPVEQFGTLYGAAGAIGGAFSCIQYALLVPAPSIGNGIAFAATICSMIASVTLLLITFSKEKKALQQ